MNLNIFESMNPQALKDELGWWERGSDQTEINSQLNSAMMVMCNILLDYEARVNKLEKELERVDTKQEKVG